MKPGFYEGNLRKWAGLNLSERVALVHALRKQGWTVDAIARMVVEEICTIRRLEETPLGARLEIDHRIIDLDPMERWNDHVLRQLALRINGVEQLALSKQEALDLAERLRSIAEKLPTAPVSPEPV